jgi:hypothetical protein
MSMSLETTLDFNNTVNTEERFEIRKFINEFVKTVNEKNLESSEPFIADGFVAEGLSEFVMQKPQLLGTFYRKFFGRKNNYMWFPKLKLSGANNLYRLDGTYEEYQQGILSTEGDVKIDLKKTENDSYVLIGMKFFPRMRLIE